MTPRTIRYYTAEGLLPPPRTHGRNAIYTDDHFRRICLIQRLKNAFLPLWEIKAQVSSLTAEEVEMLLSRKQTRPGESRQDADGVLEQPAEPQSKQSQLKYLTQILAVAEPPVAATAAPPPRRVLLVSPVFNLPSEAASPPSETQDTTHPASLIPHPSREVWERIPLVPGVELHVRIPDTPEAQERLNQLIAATQNLFTASDEPTS